jgi:hypothetical protein
MVVQFEMEMRHAERMLKFELDYVSPGVESALM